MSTLTWKRVAPGWYTATSPDGSRWDIENNGPQQWEIFRDNREMKPSAASLSVAKIYVADDVRKEARAGAA